MRHPEPVIPILLAILLSHPAVAQTVEYDCPRGDDAVAAEDLDGAIWSYSNCLAVAADQEEKRQLFLARGDVYLLLGQFIEANLDYQVALTIDRQKADTYLRLSRLSAVQGKHRDAVDHANQAILLDPENVDAFRTRAMSRIAQGFAWQAFDDLNVVLESRPDDLQARVARAEILRVIGEPRKALEEVEAVLEIEPDNKEAQLLRDVLVELIERLSNQ